ncbi:MAG: hypothetical protein NWS56_11325 [Haliea sp.]|nr:hypothetical protein [Haliea sp.]
MQAPPPITGSAHDQVPRTPPQHWPDARERFRSSAFIAANFGDEFQRAFTLLKEQEMNEFD